MARRATTPYRNNPWPNKASAATIAAPLSEDLRRCNLMHPAPSNGDFNALRKPCTIIVPHRARCILAKQWTAHCIFTLSAGSRRASVNMYSSVATGSSWCVNISSVTLHCRHRSVRRNIPVAVGFMSMLVCVYSYGEQVSIR